MNKMISGSDLSGLGSVVHVVSYAGLVEPWRPKIRRDINLPAEFVTVSQKGPVCNDDRSLLSRRADDEVILSHEIAVRAELVTDETQRDHGKTDLSVPRLPPRCCYVVDLIIPFLIVSKYSSHVTIQKRGRFTGRWSVRMDMLNRQMRPSRWTRSSSRFSSETEACIDMA
jgi:hypothetical protein